MARQSTSIRSYDAKFLACRDFRHVFGVIGYFRSESGVVRRRLKCGRCGALGYDHLNVATGERRKGRSYKYPDGYLIDGGLKVSAARVESLRRATIYRTEEAMLEAIGAPRRDVPAKKKSVHRVRHTRSNKKAGVK